MSPVHWLALGSIPTKFILGLLLRQPCCLYSTFTLNLFATQAKGKRPVKPRVLRRGHRPAAGDSRARPGHLHRRHQNTVPVKDHRPQETVGNCFFLYNIVKSSR